MADILYKTVTADTLVTGLPCYLVGAEMSHTSNTQMEIYDEPAGAATSGKLVLTVKARDTNYHYDNCIFPKAIKCSGLWADYDAGVGTVYYHY